MAMSKNAKKFLDMLRDGKSLNMRKYQNTAGAICGYSINGVRVSKNTFEDVEGLASGAVKDCFTTTKNKVSWTHAYTLRRTSNPVW